MQMGPWLIAAMDILGSPAQLFSLLYLSLSDLLVLPARNLRLALAYASCLLYTSPSPRDATLSRMPSSA